VLFTKRTETVGTHKGHVSFPGGRVDPGDDGPHDTALRELFEEVGVARERVRVLGLFHEATAITGVAVTPVIASLGELDVDDLRLSTDEIAAAFTLSLAQLADPLHRSQQAFGRLKAPRFTAGPHPVWGLTAWILDEVLREAMGLDLPRLTAGDL